MLLYPLFEYCTKKYWRLFSLEIFLLPVSRFSFLSKRIQHTQKFDTYHIRVTLSDLKFSHVIRKRKIHVIRLFYPYWPFLGKTWNFKIFEFVVLCSFHFIKSSIFNLWTWIFIISLNNIFSMYVWLKNFENQFSQFFFIDVVTLLLFRYFHFFFFFARTYSSVY